MKNPNIRKWIKKNLFNTWYNSILTLVCISLLVAAVTNILNWVFNEAQWSVIQTNIHLFFVGRYPSELYWRLWSVIGIILILSVGSWAVFTQRISSRLNAFLPIAWALSFLIVLWLIGGGLGLEPVDTNLWNGLLLTLVTAVISIVLSFPLGVLLALGRQSELFAIRNFSILYIEIIRGLPLIGILFLAQVMLPLFLPIEVRLDRVVRGIAGLTLFSAAYLAENVRGGLQSIPHGQYEASRALGLNTSLMMLLVILPQALQAVIPALVGQFIGLFKDTSLLSIVGLLELTGISRSILAQPQFLNRHAEVYLFIGVLYWVFCYGMSLASQRLEKQLGVGKR
ncbi:amino acid ABC transporter permease [Aetokthonos hydrillicola Thurmond2011]|jgi:general L-amino acid transport system permease protein|uniref:Amino acid ABC transporter permease n=1 Tax=Aetokthonos hydrillicola Thurmond2011 TaxID=2712845 RepID=A0AAP5IE10_9CYAN|nr:amino acid ABC transporter permease [Aetokthonos hydrillicola]MBO3459726.1 amino acid ABC transporter permease [Aetokthonos hydrillicola CCALA 1050]MBW4585158.1 amino acid ABC transporter permease [Aetokthonos hydrillicola CCALA 1050]MDR9899497.1 amino acid ABC transporter permease [Aetokthonos hydrillicola Thurmond2011]